MLEIGTMAGKARRSLFIALLSGLLALPALAWAQGQSTRLVVFGDSLSDTGNLFVGQRVNSTPPDYLMDPLDPLLIPSAAYPRGGHGLTNGAPWVEVLARSLRSPANAGPALRSENPRATNYAVAGARAYDDGINFNLASQVGVFLADFEAGAPSGALYVIAIGGSDVRDTLFNGDFSIVFQGVESIAANIQALHQAGARKFLVWNAPNVGLAPSIRVLEPHFQGLSATATFVSGLFNSILENRLVTLDALPGIEIVRYDIFTALTDFHANPATYGLVEVDQPCITPNVAPFKCRKPDQYLFWDGLHPTSAVHAIVARQVEALLAP